MSPRRTGHAGHQDGPIERFLGAAAAAGGPFALLELAPQLCDDENILAALDRQLDRVVKHPECDTPEADEVRLALHAAAAQLLDPGVRRQMLARWAGVVASAAARTSAAGPERLLEHDAILTLGLYGGWNRRSLRRLVALAHARGLSSEHVAATLRALARGGRRRPPGRPVVPQRRTPAPVATARPAPLHPSTEPLAEQIDPGLRLLRVLLIVGAAGVAALAFGIATIVAVWPREQPAPTPIASGPDAPDPAPATDESAPERTADAARPPAPRPHEGEPAETPAPSAPAPPRTVDVASLGRVLAASAQALEADPDGATARFETAVGDLAGNWPKLPKEALVAAHDSVVEFVYRTASRPELTARALAAIARGATSLTPDAPFPADQLWPAVWSTGMLARLSRESDLSVAAKAQVESALRAALGPSALVDGTFDSGASAMLAAIPGRLLAATPGERRADNPWIRWADAVAAFATGNPELQTRLLLSGLEAIMLGGAEPDADRAVFDAIGAIGTRIPWREGDESRRRLLRWFEDRRISNADLHALTAALAARSSAAGVDVTMVLSTAASEGSRAALRDRYAQAWGVGGGDAPSDVASDWVVAARDLLMRSEANATSLWHLTETVALSRLNEAALWQWRGEAPEAERLLAELWADLPDSAAPAPPSNHVVTLLGEGGDWGVSYLAAKRNIPIRLDLLDRLSSGGGLTALDAEVLAAEALGGPQAEVRRKAQEVLKQFASDPIVVNAVLEFLPRAPRVVSNAETVEYIAGRALPGIKDPGWETAARRGLVERLLELIASQGRHGQIDELSRLLAASYRSRAAAAVLTADERREDPQPMPHLSAAAEWAWWRAVADSPLSSSAGAADLDAIERRRAGRAGQADGYVQAFAAEQVSLCELMAHVIRAERPDRADIVDAVLARMGEERRRAEHVFEQLHAVERAMTRLWLIRYGEELG